MSITNASSVTSAESVAPRISPSVVKTTMILVALSLSMFVYNIESTIIATAIPSITESLSSASGYSWIGSAYLLAVTAALPMWGVCSDTWGRKWAILAASCIFFVGSLTCALSVSMTMLIIARVIQGIGGSGLNILVYIIISDLFSIRDRAKHMSNLGMVMALAGAIGPIVGGMFAQKVSWRWCFYINLPVVSLAFLLLLIFLDIPRSRITFLAGLKTIDVLGVGTIIGASVMFLLAIEFGGGGVTFSWSSPTIICLFVFSFITLTIFIFIEWQVGKSVSRRPVVPFRALRDRSSIAILVVVFLHGVLLFAPFYYLPLYFQAVKGFGPIVSGACILPTALSSTLSALLTGRFIERTGFVVQPIWYGFFLSTLGTGLLISLDYDAGWARIIIYQLLVGGGLGPNFFSPLVALQRLVEPRDLALATSSLAFLRQLGYSISIALGGAMFQIQIEKHQSDLVPFLGSEIAQKFAGSNAAANVPLINELPTEQRQFVRRIFALSISPMWYIFFAIAGLCLLTSCIFIDTKKLAAEKEEAVTSELWEGKSLEVGSPETSVQAMNDIKSDV